MNGQIVCILFLKAGLLLGCGSFKPSKGKKGQNPPVEEGKAPIEAEKVPELVDGEKKDGKDLDSSDTDTDGIDTTPDIAESEEKKAKSFYTGCLPINLAQHRSCCGLVKRTILFYLNLRYFIAYTNEKGHKRRFNHDPFLCEIC